MSIQVGDGLMPLERPETVPDAVERTCFHSNDLETRREFAEALLKNNVPLYLAIEDAYHKERGRHINSIEDGVACLIRWASFADSINQFVKSPPTLTLPIIDAAMANKPIAEIPMEEK
jgi:hypothetical protein